MKDIKWTEKEKKTFQFVGMAHKLLVLVEPKQPSHVNLIPVDNNVDELVLLGTM